MPSSAANFQIALSRALEAEQVTPVGPPQELSMQTSDPRLLGREALGSTLPLSFKAPPANQGQFMIATDQSGLTRFVFGDTPLDVKAAPAMSSLRADTQTFTLGREYLDDPQLMLKLPSVGQIANMSWEIVRFPIDVLLGAGVAGAAWGWEKIFRKYGVLRLDVASAAENSPVDWQPMKKQDPFWHELARGRSLLMIHGTFSRTDDCFAALPKAMLRELHKRYSGRVFALEHPTMAHDPLRNAKWMLAQMPPGLKLDCDIVCHSRGGLVARAFAEQHPKAAGRQFVGVRRIVFVAVPNRGTMLASPSRLKEFLNAHLMLLQLATLAFPPAAYMQALVHLAKLIAAYGMPLLPGLTSMDPVGRFQKRLNGHAGKPANQLEYYGLGSDFEPSGPALAIAADNLVDGLFKHQGNDLVVPSDGVYAANGHPLFPITGVRNHSFAAGQSVIHHLSYFGDDVVQQFMLRWLKP